MQSRTVLTIMQISYRSLYHPSSLVRRLRYVSQLIGFVAHTPQNRDVLATKLKNWSIKHDTDFTNYKYNTGAAHSVKSSRRIDLAEGYITLSVKFGLLSEISNVFHLTRIGRVLYCLLTDSSNASDNTFYLNEDERLFYTFQLLQKDADNLLTVLNIVQLHETIDLKNLKENFYKSFTKRLKVKIATCSKEYTVNQLHDRYIKVREKWKKPVAYASYFLPPRLNWLLDLGLLDSSRESNRNLYQLTETSKKLLQILPNLNNSTVTDVSDIWFDTQFFSDMTPLISHSTDFKYWMEIDDNARMAICKEYLPKAFELFRQSHVPKISFKQTVLFLCLSFGREFNLISNISELIQWLQTPRILDNYIYEARISARENESYIIRRHA